MIRKMIASLVMLLGMTTLHADMVVADGLPVPWPFPWAKECPVNWDDMVGKYVMTDGSASGRISLRISIVVKRSFRLIRVSRYGTHGELLYDGSTTLNEAQRIVRLYLMPADKNADPVYATIKLHYPSWEMNCAADRLVPILSLRPVDSTDPGDQVQYRLVRIE
jgi:hypothetical protein